MKIVKVLARRANGLLMVAPICFVVLLCLLNMSIVVMFHMDCPEWFEEIAVDFLVGENKWWYSQSEIYTSREVMNALALSLVGLITCLVSFFDRLFLPKILIEYDDVGLYIYHNKKDVTLLRYDYLAGQNVRQDLDEVSFWIRYRGMVKVTNFSGGLIKTGSIRFECPDGFVNVRGIANVKEVSREISRMVRRSRDEYEKEFEEKLREYRNQKDLEELLKHNPDT